MEKHYKVVDRKLCVTTDTDATVVVYVNPDDAQKRFLVDHLKLDEHTLNSALDPDELSRLEFEPEHAAFIFKRPRSYSQADQFLLKVTSLGAYLFKDKLVVVMADDAPLLDGPHSLRSCTPAYLLLRLIYRSIYHFLEHLKVVRSISDELQDQINTSMENRHLINLFTLDKSLVYYLNSINANGALLEKMKLNAAKIGFTSEEIELLDDTHIENTQCFKQAEIYSNILTSLMDARASIVGNNLNVLMKTLNFITIGIMMPTLVVSVFSMNVPIPWQHQPLTFWGILIVAMCSALGVMLFWRRKRW